MRRLVMAALCLLGAACIARGDLLGELLRRRTVVGAAPSSWTPPYAANIAWSATFDGDLLRKASSDSSAADVAAQSPYARAPWATSNSTNTDPYIGWYDTAYDTVAALLVTNLGSGNAVGVLSTNAVANKFAIPNTYTADMVPAPTSTTWTIAWWMKPIAIDVGDQVLAPEATSPSLSSVYLYRQDLSQFRWASVASFSYTPTTNAWQLWVVTSHRELWVNGSLINSNGTQFAQIPKRMTLGGSGGIGTTASIPGLYDDVYYWDGWRFTGADVSDLYSHGSPEVRPGL